MYLSRDSFLIFTILLFWAPQLRAQETYQMPPPELAQLVDAPLTPTVSLSPDGAHMLLLERPGMPSIAELAAPELRLAGTRFDPHTSGPSRSGSYTGLTVRAVHGEADRAVTNIPADPLIRNVQWAPDGQRFAFTVTGEDRIELYLAGVADARARKVAGVAVHNVYGGSPFEWLPDARTLLVRTVPADRAAEPEPERVPAGPVIRESSGDEAPARTYQDLLTSPYDEALFEHYVKSRLALVGIDGTVRPFAEPMLLQSTSVSPDGRYVLIESLHRPFSHLVPAFRFPRRIELYDLAGRRVHQVADLPLAENVPSSFGSVPTGPRGVSWRSDVPATLAWVEALDGGDARKEAEMRDRVFLLPAPFTGDPEVLITLPLRVTGVQWGRGDLALVSESWYATRMRRTYRVRPDEPGAEAEILFEQSTEDRYSDPGNPMMTSSPEGKPVLVRDGDVIYFFGIGASPEGNRPFLRAMNVQTKEVDELFRSSEPYYEEPVTMLANQRLLTRRESVDEVPNYYLRDLSSGSTEQITHFPHPYPQLADIQKELVIYDREDGVPLTATLYLPAGYEPGRDDPLPGLVWAYPREYKSADAAGQVSDSPYRFTYLGTSGAIPYVTQGYAVVAGASMPIIGEGDEEPNDRFVDQLVMSARAAIRMGADRGVLDPDRVAIAGHSYGAFMTANLLAHSDLFRAGIARSGAYNRTLTPFGFQAEERLFWEAPEVYFTMSPFMHAANIEEPLLLIHGAADNNSGTFPMQSERLYNALTGLGKTTRLVLLPHESHGYSARESVLHVLWETNRWLELYVKQAQPRAPRGG